MSYIKKIKIVVLVSSCIISLLTNSLAHSGRTDKNGGHKDNKNVSGLGNYHYHCGGYPAHLHTNGYCPYTSDNTYVDDNLNNSSKEEIVSSTTIIEKDIEVKEISINEKIENMKVGDTLKLTTSIIPDDADDKSVIWQSSNENIATVSDDGIVTAVSMGSVTISASTSNDKKSEVIIKIESEESSIGVGTVLLIGGAGFLGYKKFKNS